MIHQQEEEQQQEQQSGYKVNCSGERLTCVGKSSGF
jgi:hypothetical protein